MHVLHAHWQPSRSAVETGGFIFWAETSDAPQPAWQRGRRPLKPQPKDHPYCLSFQEVQSILERSGKEAAVFLRLPTTRTGPLPSPALVHAWDLDREARPYLASWGVKGVFLPAAEAFKALINLPVPGDESEEGQISSALAAEVHFWQQAATLVLETLAAQKLVPVLVPVDGNAQGNHAQGNHAQGYQARWLPVLDGPKDAPRLALLEKVMPPVCRAEAVASDGAQGGYRGKVRDGARRDGRGGHRSMNTGARGGAQGGTQSETPSARRLLNTFLNTMCDELARRWGVSSFPHPVRNDEPWRQWLGALHSEDPAVAASPAQLQALAVSHRAWMRNLHAAGDPTFRIAFRLVAPTQQVERASPEWQIQYLLQARDDPSLLVPAETVWDTRGSFLNHLDRRFEQPQEKLLAGLGYAGRLFPPVMDSLKNKRPTHLTLDTNTAYNFLREVSPVLEGAGFGLLVPPWWNKPGTRLGLRLRMKAAKGQAEVTQSRMNLQTLVNYRWQMSLGETSLTEEEFRALAALKSPLVQLRGQWVQLDPEQIEAAIQFWEKQQQEGQMSLLEALQAGDIDATGGLPVDDVVTEGWLAEWLEHFNHSEKLVELAPPAGLKGELRPYQLFGYSWLQFHRQWGLGAILADDMGLGKTIQTIALLLHEKETCGSLPAPTLMVSPTSVVTNWEHEIRRFAPGLTTLIHQGAGRLHGDDFIQASKDVDMVLTSYALMRQDAELLQSVSWLGVVLDEAQNIKNPVAKQTQVARKLPAEFRLALTGTPVENRLSELWSIMNFLNPGYLGPREKFRSNYALPIERYNDQEALQHLKKITGPFILRRMKTDPRVIQDLPDKFETKEYCNLSEEQATLYEAVVQDVMKQIEEKSGIERRGLVLSMLMQLKQVCNHPAQYLRQPGAASETGQDFGSRSGKLERLVEMLEEILSEHDRVLLFTQFAEMGHLLESYLPHALGTAVQYLYGGTPAKAREQMVRRFQEEESAPPIFILSLKAGGTGLNLTGANHVIHFDRWWNPAVEDQATDRAFRIGQMRNVQVHKFVTTGTLEEMIDDLIESKKGLAQAVVGTGEQWLTELSTDDLREAVKLRRT